MRSPRKPHWLAIWALSRLTSSTSVFRLEKAFDIKIPRGELFPEDVWTNADYVQDGKVTESGLEELRRRMPFANLDEFAKNPVVQEFGSLLTVADMCRFVEGKVDATD